MILEGVDRVHQYQQHNRILCALNASCRFLHRRLHDQAEYIIRKVQNLKVGTVDICYSYS